MMKKKDKKINIAQAASELAIFGAMLVFLAGMMVRTGLSNAHGMNARLRAMRLALTESYKTANGQYGGVSSRNTASVLILDDRLSASSEPLGSRDRAPYVGSATGVMSDSLFYPVDWGEISNLPVYDAFFNGLRFVFTMADMVSYRIAENDGSQPAWIPSCPNPNVFGGPAWSPPYGICWAPSCLNDAVYELAVPAGTGTYDWDPYMGNYVPASPAGTGTHNLVSYVRGCTLMFRVIYNFDKQDDPPFCAANPCGRNLPADGIGGRFDVFRDGANVVPAMYRTNYMWQWVLVPGVHHEHIGKINYAGLNAALGVAGISNLEGIQTGDESKNTTVDTDGDLKMERVLALNNLDNGVITRIHVIDRQEGDMDGSSDDNSAGRWREVQWVGGSCGPAPTGLCVQGVQVNGDNAAGECVVWECVEPISGIQENVVMFTQTNEGTYLRLQEGQLMDPATGQYIRKTNMNNSEDMIQRVFYISNDTDRFCDSASLVRNWGGGVSPNAIPPISGAAVVPGTNGIPNPVEACNNCFSAAHNILTCFDEAELAIYIRSRIEDVRGRRWVTQLRNP